ncbi:MAG: transposase [Syntrophorhabdales bacterium]|jgi:putative transposase
MSGRIGYTSRLFCQVPAKPPSWNGRCRLDVHALLSVSPKRVVPQAVGSIKGKSAIYVVRMSGRSRIFVGQNLWARGYCVSIIGLDETAIREFQTQEETDNKFDQMRLFEKDR